MVLRTDPAKDARRSQLDRWDCMCMPCLGWLSSGQTFSLSYTESQEVCKITRQTCLQLFVVVLLSSAYSRGEHRSLPLHPWYRVNADASLSKLYLTQHQITLSCHFLILFLLAGIQPNTPNGNLLANKHFCISSPVPFFALVSDAY